jgi:hypothetical protein
MFSLGQSSISGNSRSAYHLNNFTKPNLTLFKQTYLLQVFRDTFRYVFVDLVPTPDPWHQLRNDLKKERKFTPFSKK